MYAKKDWINGRKMGNRNSKKIEDKAIKKGTQSAYH